MKNFRRATSVSAMAVTVLWAAPALAALGDRAGVAAAVRGKVTQIAHTAATGSVGRVVSSGDEIRLGDKIASGPNSGLQIMLLDQTVFTIGPDSAVVIDEFVYDPSTGSGKLTASILKGVFRFVSGRIAAKNPKNMTVKLPVGSIGVRGTSAMGEVTGQNALVALIGEGPRNDLGRPAGRIIVNNAGVAREVFRAAYYVTITGLGAAPSLPAPLPPAIFNRLTAALSIGAGQVAGRRGAAGGRTGGSTPTRAAMLRRSGRATAAALLGAFTEAGTLALTSQLAGSITTATQNLQGGKFVVGPTTHGMTGSGTAQYTFKYVVDLGSRTSGGLVTLTTLTNFNTIGTGTFELLRNVFNEPPGPPPTETGSPIGLPGTISVTFELFGDKSVPRLDKIDHTVTYTESSVTATGSGSSPATKVP